MLFLERLKAQRIRNLQELDIEPARCLNYFYGPNASGKTSILETIFLLSRVKSFRSKRVNSVITHGERSLSVFAKGMNQQQSFTLGVEKGVGLTKLKYNGDLVQTASEQAKALPVFLLAPDHSMLFYGGPKERRHWLDWSLFHVKPDYLTTWKSYHRALRHRNALLKSQRNINTAELEGWERLMSDDAAKLDEARFGYLDKILQIMNRQTLNTVLEEKARVEYKNSLAGNSLFETLQKNRADDIQRGFCSVGPHRADIVFYYDDLNVAKHLSRGQIKLFGAALIASQLEILRQESKDALVLVDDIDAELDSESSKKILSLLTESNVQTFISSLSIQDWVPNTPGKHAVFHVKHGVVNKVLK